MSTETPPLTLADITVKRFMSAMFNGDYEGISNWEQLFTAYIDLSGMGNQRQLGLCASMHNLEIRLWVIDQFMEIQKKAIATFDLPYQPAFEMVQRYGHRVLWDGNIENFKLLLARITAKEKRNVAEYDRLQKEYADLQKSGVVKETVSARHDFIRLLNRISEKVKVDREKDDMESVCLIIRDYLDECEMLNNKQ